MKYHKLRIAWSVVWGIAYLLLIAGASEVPSVIEFKNEVIRLPYFLLVALSAAAVAVPWLRWRFSLRTLLIATTLVAVGLGWIVYANRN